jgi:hypothetical protein
MNQPVIRRGRHMPTDNTLEKDIWALALAIVILEGKSGSI